MSKIKELVNRVTEIMSTLEFVGIGSTRKVYKYESLVIKMHLHRIGYLQSVKEQAIYNELNQKGRGDFIAPILYVDEKITIQPFYTSLPLKNGQTYNIDLEGDKRLTQELRTVIAEIDQKYDGFDLLDSGNYGLNQNGKLILIDYGMTKMLYESEWVPLATAGILPQIFFEKCQVCGQDKELRIYGENDMDRRCVGCGKE